MRTLLLSLFLPLVQPALAQGTWTLQQCLARAEERNLAVLNAALDAQLAGENKDRTYWDLLPDLNGVATHGYNYGRVIDRFTNTFATDRVRTNNFYLSSQLDLFRGLSKQNSIKQARFDADAAMKGLEAARNDVRVSVVQAFLNVLGLRERIAAAEAQAANTRAQIERVRALVEGGRVARAEQLTLEAQLAQEEFNVTDVRNQHDQQMLVLGRTMQLEATEMMAFDIVAPAISDLEVVAPTASEHQVLENVLRTHPAYAQAELQVRSAEKSVAITQAGRLPSLSLSGSLGTGYSGRDIRTVGDPVIGDPVIIGATAGGEVVYAPNISYNTELTPFSTQLDQNLNQSIGFTLNIPIFNNMRNHYAVQQARVQQEKTRNGMTSLRNDLQRNVLDALVQQRSAHRQFLAASKAVESGTVALEFAQERYDQGVITVIELNTAKTNLNNSTANLINAKYQYLMASKYLDILQGIPVSL
ncbi:MAG TPA: TolC family protein [Flavobacteriales bacterium]|nr:TolC family protein [Flavobacteriales bacterium]HNU57431.1 TolC family protein [Flavobacteriales bacterium]